MMKIGIVGSEGFVGSFLKVALTNAGHEIAVFDNKFCETSASFLDVSTTIPETKFLGLDAVINLAAEHRDDVRPESRYVDVNVGGAARICDAASRAGVRTIVFTSSVAVYGFAPPNTGEDGEFNYFNEYGRTKRLAEEEYLRWHREGDAERCLVIVRPSVIFGPGNRGNVYNLLNQIASGRFVMFGGGENVKSMAYVENVVAFLLQCVTSDPGVHVYNYLDKPDFTMNGLVEETRLTLFDKPGVGVRLPAVIGILIGKGFNLVSWLIRRPLPVSDIRVKKFMSTTQFSSAASATGFKPPYSLVEGLRKTLRYEFLEENDDKPTYETE